MLPTPDAFACYTTVYVSLIGAHLNPSPAPARVQDIVTGLFPRLVRPRTEHRPLANYRKGRMPRTHIRYRLGLLAMMLGAVALLTGCEMPFALDPRGPAASEIARIWWILLWTAVAVSVVVFTLLGVALKRARSASSGDAPLTPEASAQLEGRTTGFVLIGGGLIPALILVVATVITLSGLAVFDRPPDGVDHSIVVRGHMFWWEVSYPEHGIVTANEIHIPVGRPVRVELESADVIHSFWVPQLHGKMEMIPGKTNVIYMQADEPGTYFGKCAEFCGISHANMEFLFIAQEEDEFEAWLERQASDATEPADGLALRGRDVFVESPCALCHNVRGVSSAAAEAGPDLTHLASRRTLGARTLVNVRGNLAGWILDPQGIKPGNRMPAVTMEPDDFHALLAFLEGLR